MGHVTDDAAHRFLSIDARDQFLWKLARGLATARVNGVVPRRFSTVNTATSDSPGFHWVSVVYSIEMKKEDHGTQSGTEEVHSPAASSQHRLNFTGSAHQAPLFFYARMDSQTPRPRRIRTTREVPSPKSLLFWLPQLGSLISKNMARAQRLRAEYKNRLLVS